jgi:hypothetical protein
VFSPSTSVHLDAQLFHFIAVLPGAIVFQELTTALLALVTLPALTLPVLDWGNWNCNWDISFIQSSKTIITLSATPNCELV